MRFFLDLHAFFGFHRLVQAIGPLTSVHQTTGEFVNDDDLAILDDVVHVFGIKRMSSQRVVDHVRPFHVARRVETFYASKLFGMPNTFIRQSRRMIFFVDLVVKIAFQLQGDFVGFGVSPRVGMSRSGDNQWCTGFINQNVIHFVNDRESQAALRLLQS